MKKPIYQIILVGVFSFVCFAQAQAQAQLFPKFGIPVLENNDTLANAWMGGLDLPQFSGSDINQDGREDLLIFDRKAHKTIALLKNEDGSYKYAPDLEPAFPEIREFALFRDYNCDGLEDIFAFVNLGVNGGQGIQLFEQEIVGGELSYSLRKDILQFDLGGFAVNIYCSRLDIPGIEDIDGDGDIDIVSFGPSGIFIPLYRNLSAEMGYGCDSLIFEEYSSCWGQFRESSVDNTINFDISCKGGGSSSGPIPSGGPKHAGSTILLFDPNEDGRMDAALGDVSFNSVVYVQNDASSLDAHMNSSAVDYTYPSYSIPTDVEIFPASYYVDVTNDGKKDLLVAPNATTAHVNTTSSWLYENTGDTNQTFQFVQDDFLIDQCIDAGSYSFPVLFDHNADGLEDLIVANGFVYENMGTTVASLRYYENMGNDTLPVFSLVDDNYMGLSNFGADYLRPTFGDMDDDGDQDMVLGDANGLVHLYENTAGAGNPANFTLAQLQLANIDVGNKAHPQLIDLNEDGLLDLVIGREGSFGELIYYWNFGTADNPQFSVDSANQALGNIQVNEPGFVPGFSAPHFLKTDSNTILYVGNDLGFIPSYLVNQDSLKSGSFERLALSTLPTRVGVRSTLSIGDIDSDNVMDYFVGNARGGVSIYTGFKSDDSTIIDTTGLSIRNKENGLAFELYPNPSAAAIILELNQKEQVEIQIFNNLGQLVKHAIAKDEKTIMINVEALSKGLYFVKISNTDGNIGAQSFIKK